MSHDLKVSNAQKLDKQVFDFVQKVVDKPSPRGIAMALEAVQRYDEYLDELKNHATFETSVTVEVEVEGQKIKFSDTESLAGWLEGLINGN